MNGPLPLTYTEMSTYAHDYAFATTLEDLDEFCLLMRVMDDTLLTHLRSK